MGIGRPHHPVALALILLWLAVLAVSACSLSPSDTQGTALATPTNPASASWTPVLPYPTPAAWQHFTALSSDFTVDYPGTWASSPPLDSEVIFDANPFPAGAEHARPHAEASIIAYTDHPTVASLCPQHPDTTIAGLPAAVSTGQDTIGRPYQEWQFANSAIAFRFRFTIAVGAGTLHDYATIYTHMLASLVLAPAYVHAPPCSAA